MNQYYFPIDDNVKKSIYMAIQNGLHDMNDFKSWSSLSFENGFQLLTWAYIYHRLYHEVPIKNGINLKTNRGPWPLVVMLDAKSGYAYLVMTKKNFIRLQKMCGKHKVPHYLEAMASLNKGIENELLVNGLKANSYQMDFDFEIDSQEIGRILSSMLKEQVSKMKRVAVITYEKEGNATELTMIVPYPDLEIAYDETWDIAVKMDFETTQGAGNENELGDNDGDDGLDLDFKQIDEKKGKKDE